MCRSVPMMVGVAGGGKRDVAANADRLLVEGADAAADGIDQKRLHPLDGRGVDIFVGQAMGIGGEPLRKRANGRSAGGCAGFAPAIREATGSAAALVARCRKALRGSFMAFSSGKPARQPLFSASLAACSGRGCLGLH